MHIPDQPLPPEPNPGPDIAQFLGWLVMLGGMGEYSKCKRKCQVFKIDLDEILKRFSDKIVIKKIARKGGTDKIVQLVDWDWSLLWAEYHKKARGHHRHQVP